LEGKPLPAGILPTHTSGVFVPSIRIVVDVLNHPKYQALPKIVVGFPRCQKCHRKVKVGFAVTDGWQWSFGHASFTPNGYWIKASDFEQLAEVLDWAFHLAEKQGMDLHSWLAIVEYVRPQWLPAVKEVLDRFFADRYRQT
jgi:hypothetical protein